MVARLLNLCGLYLGPDSDIAAAGPDNKEGYWENINLVELNDRVLALFNAGWDLPPLLPHGWKDWPGIADLRNDAAHLVERFAGHEPWGWKDPRNSVTLPFWADLIPNLRILVCLRNPIEVAQSLNARNYSSIPFGLKLWLSYNQPLLDRVNDRTCVFTHYDAYFTNPGDELRRVLGLLNIPASDEAIDRACATASLGMRNQSAPVKELPSLLPPDVLKCYLELCKHAGPVYEAFHEARWGNLSQQLEEATGVLQKQADTLLLRSETDEKVRLIAALNHTVSLLGAALKSQRNEFAIKVRKHEKSADILKHKIAGLEKHQAESAEQLKRDAELIQSIQTKLDSLGKSETPSQVHEREKLERTKELLQAQLSAKSHELDKILQSTGWKLLKRYGRVKYRHLLPLYRLLRLPPYGPPVAGVDRQPRLADSSLNGNSASEFATAQEDSTPSPERLPERYLVPLSLESNKCDIVCFPIIDWDFRFQRPQQLMSQFADAGHRVFYVASGSPSSGAAYTIQPKRSNVFEVSLHGLEQVVYADEMSQRGCELLFASLDELRRDICMGATVSIAQLPFWLPLVEKARDRFAWPIVYDCMDHHAGFSTNKMGMVDREEDLLATADLVVVSSTFLHEKAVQNNPNVLMLRNACDYEHFSNVGQKKSTRTTIGYYGAIADWFDSDLVSDLAQRRPDWEFILVGSTFSADLRRLSKLPNVFLPGEKHYAEIPSWLGEFDVAIIPFRRSPLTEATNPVKAYEILASGKPLVSVPIPEVQSLKPLVRLASTAEEFEREIEAALAEDDPQLPVERISFAKQNTWEERYKKLAPSIIQSFPKASVIIVTYNNLKLNRLCLESVFGRTEWPNLEVIVVDNNSTDGTREYLREAENTFPHLSIILNDDNLGFAAANNMGLRQATGEFLVLLNNDTVVTRGWLSTLIRHLHANPAIGLIGPATNSIGNEAKVEVDYTSLDDMPSWAANFVREQADNVFLIPMLAMFCLAMRKEVFEKIGPLDEQFGIGMFEDDDYTHRVKLEGFRVACAADVFVHHFGQASFKELVNNGKYQGLFDENRQRFERKWKTQWIPHQYASTEYTAKPDSAGRETAKVKGSGSH